MSQPNTTKQVKLKSRLTRKVLNGSCDNGKEGTYFIPHTFKNSLSKGNDEA